MIVEIIVGVIVAGAAYFAPTAINYIRHLSRSGINISGAWQIYQPEHPEDGGDLKHRWRTEINLRHIGRRISGTAIAHCLSDDVPDVHYEVHGHIDDGYVDAIFRDKEESRMSRSVFLLKVNGTGRTLMGYRAFTGVITDTPRTIECEWRRPGASAVDVDCNRRVG